MQTYYIAVSLDEIQPINFHIEQTYQVEAFVQMFHHFEEIIVIQVPLKAEKMILKPAQIVQPYLNLNAHLPLALQFNFLQVID